MLGKQIIQEEHLTNCYLSISNGQLVHSRDGVKSCYDEVSGKLSSIRLEERTFKAGQTEKFWYIGLRDQEEKMLYYVSLPYSSGVFLNIILSLASLETLSKETLIKLHTYSKNGYSKVQTIADGHILSWVTKDLPAVETIQVGSKSVRDDSKRMEMLLKYVEQVKAKIA